MKTIFSIYILLLFFLLSCNKDNKQDDNHDRHDDEMEDSKDSQNDQKKNKKIYTCPMHPQIVQDKPGTCPICGMDLVEKIDNTHGKKLNLGAVIEPANETVLSSVRTIKPEHKSISRIVDAPGYITYNPTNASSVSSLYSGRIDKLYVKYNFQEVKKGQKIFEIYSPDLLTVQQNLLFLLKNDSSATTLIESNKERLRLLGMTEVQIRNLVRTQKPASLLSVYSPVSGHIHQMNNLSEITMPTMEMRGDNSEMSSVKLTQEISIKEGDYIQKGQTVFSIVTTNRLWAILKIYPEDAGRIKVGQKVSITVESQPNISISAKVNFIEPMYESGSKHTTVRVFLDNSNHHDLTIGSLIKGKITTGMQEGIWVPRTAVIDLGNNNYVVFIKSDKVFKTLRVSIGDVVGEEIEVIEGLSLENEIAVDAQYLVDSESFVQVSK